MSRATLLLLQVVVAAIAIGLWYVLATYEIFGVMVLPPFFFSTPVDVAERIVRLFVGGTIWKLCGSRCRNPCSPLRSARSQAS